MGILSRLTAHNFRNLTDLDMELAPGINLLTGSNGQGKSNVLEALCYLGLLRSFRTHSVSELVHWEHDQFHLKAVIRDDDPAFSFDLAMVQGEKRVLRVNGTAVRRTSDFVNRFICVPLVPEDINLVKGPASERRRFLDIALSQQNLSYMMDLQRYRDAVKSRNILLRKGPRMDNRVLTAYDEVMIRHGARVEATRRQYVGDFDGELQALSHSLLDAETGPYGVSYGCSGIGRDLEETSEQALEQALADALGRSRDRDLREGNTTVGPHRGDLKISIGGRSLADYGSEGECRLGCLALRLTSLQHLCDHDDAGRSIVVLVDDVIGELDSTRRGNFFKVLERADQAVITSTSVPSSLARTPAMHYNVKKGTLERV